jgi:muramidase (phage lysozyme)
VTRAQRIFLFLALLGAGTAAYAGQRRAAVPGGAAAGPAAPAEQGGALDFWSWVPAPQRFDWIGAGVSAAETADMQTFEVPMDPQRNVAALLQTIKQTEGTANQADPYRVCFGYRHTIVSLREHPAITGEWKGERLTDEQCRGAGFGPGCVSTAAGAYQIIRPTWERVRDRLGLVDFGPASQDRAAVELLRATGALYRIEQGDLAGAIAAARSEWASLPGANYAGQGMRSMAYVQTAYLNAGGALA